MKFELNGITYRVRFTRSGDTTYADLDKLFRIDGADETGYFTPTKLVGESTPYKSSTKSDRFVKSTGRKVALANLLIRMQQISAGDTTPEFVLTKEDKRSIWDTYFLTHKK